MFRRIFDHFDLLAPVYEHFIKPREPDKLISLLNLPSTGCLLDAGGGTGRITQYIQKAVASVVIADMSHGMLRQAAKKPGFHLVCSQTEHLPFAEGSFARIMMVDALHHVLDYRKTAQELWRLVEKGGRLVIEEPDIDTQTVKLLAVAEKIALMRSNFVAPDVIASLFSSSDAIIQIIRSDYQAWIVVDKVN